MIISATTGKLEGLEKIKAERSAILATHVEELTALFNELEDSLQAEQVRACGRLFPYECVCTYSKFFAFELAGQERTRSDFPLQIRLFGKD